MASEYYPVDSHNQGPHAPLVVNSDRSAYPIVPDLPPNAIERNRNSSTISRNGTPMQRKMRSFFAGGLGTAARAGNYGKWVQRFFRLTLTMRCQMIFNVVLLFLVTYLTVVVTQDDSAYMRNVKSSLKEIVAPGGNEASFNSEFNHIFVYTWKEVVKHVKATVTSFYTFNDTNPDRWLYVKEPDGSYEPIQLAITTYTNKNLFHDRGNVVFDKITTMYGLTLEDPLGPLNTTDAELGQMFELLYTMKLSMRIRNPSFSLEQEIVYRQWTLDVLYDFTDRGGRILLDIEVNNQVSMVSHDQNINTALHPVRMILNVSVVLGSLITMVVTYVSLSVSFGHYQDHVHMTRKMGWWRLKFIDKIRTMGFWFILNQVSLLVNIVGSAMEMVWLLGYWQHYKNSINIVVGLQPMVAWVHILRYIEVMSAHRSILAVALRKGLQSALTFIIYAFPIFVGYALFGMRYFSETSVMFQSFDQAAVTLFAVLNGDIINDTFGAIYPAQSTVSRVYLYTFIFLFIYACLNIFIVIMEDSFHLAKVYEKRYRNRYERYFNQQLWDSVLRDKDKDGTDEKDVSMYDYIPSGDMPAGMDGRPRGRDGTLDPDMDDDVIEDLSNQIREMEASQRRLVNEIEILRSAHDHLATTVEAGNTNVEYVPIDEFESEIDGDVDVDGDIGAGNGIEESR